MHFAMKWARTTPFNCSTSFLVGNLYQKRWQQGTGRRDVLKYSSIHSKHLITGLNCLRATQHLMHETSLMPQNQDWPKNMMGHVK